jgi:hypothetical protein
MSRKDHPVYGGQPLPSPAERPTETVTEVLVTADHHYYEVRLIVALPNYECGHRPSALDMVMDSIDEDFLVLESSETPVHLFTVKEVNR